MSKPCPREEEVARLLFEDLPEDRRRELERHLETCLICRREMERLEQTVQRLREWPDAAVPAHFLVPAPGRGPVSAFVRLSPPWRAAVAASLLLMVGLAAAWLADLKVSAQDGALTLQWNVAERQAERLEALRDDLAARLDERLDQQRRELLTEVRTELASLEESSSRQTEQTLRAGLGRLQQRLEAQLEARTLELDSRVERTGWAVQSLARRQQQALQLLQDRIDLIAVSGEIQGTQNELMLTTLLEMTDRRSPRSGGFEGLGGPNR